MPVLIADTGPDAAPAAYTLTPGQAFRLQSVYASFDGTNATDEYRPCLTLYSQAGQVLARTFPDEVVNANESAEVSFVPFAQAV